MQRALVAAAQAAHEIHRDLRAFAEGNDNAEHDHPDDDEADGNFAPGGGSAEDEADEDLVHAEHGGDAEQETGQDDDDGEDQGPPVAARAQRITERLASEVGVEDWEIGRAHV
mgnify:CR=1 FL=1